MIAQSPDHCAEQRDGARGKRLIRRKCPVQVKILQEQNPVAVAKLVKLGILFVNVDAKRIDPGAHRCGDVAFISRPPHIGDVFVGPVRRATQIDRLAVQ
jgi:hypothetical protein